MPCPLMMGNDLIRGGRRLHGPRREGSSWLKVTHLIHFFVFLLLCLGEVVKQLLGAEKETWVSGQDLKVLQRDSPEQQCLYFPRTTPAGIFIDQGTIRTFPNKY